MPKRVYRGSHAEVEILLDGSVITAKRDGAPVEVDAETAASLDVSGNWEPVTASVSKSEKEQADG